MIPKIIHQTANTSDITIKKWMDSWETMNPSCTYRFYSDADNAEFLNNHFPEWLPIFKSYPYKIQQIDILRLLYLYEFGGIYLDSDIEPLRPIDDLFTEEQLFFEPSQNRIYLDFLVSNYVMIFSKQSQFIKDCLDTAKARSKYVGISKANTILKSTGPLLITEVYYTRKLKGESVPKINSSDLFSPLTHDQVLKKEKLPVGEAFGVHHFKGSWW